MIGDLSTFIQFFAAIYVTITIDNLLGKRFWSPDFYRMVVDSINSYGFKKSSNVQKKLELSINRKAHELEEASRKRGAFMLICCVLLLIYSGFESDLLKHSSDNQTPILKDLPILVFLLLTFIVFVFHYKLFAKWSYVLLASLCTAIMFFLSFHIFHYIEEYDFGNSLKYVNKLCLVFLLLIPVAYQIYINWLYSSVYMFHLKLSLNKEYELYKQAREALDQKDENIVPEEYKSVFLSLFFNEDKKTDMQVTKIVNYLFSRLEDTCKPTSSWNLLKVYFKRKKIISNIDVHNTELPDENLPVINSIQSIDEAYNEYMSLSPRPRIETFCKNHNIPEDSFREHHKRFLKISSSLTTK